jgi:hypothetical protein
MTPERIGLIVAILFVLAFAAVPLILIYRPFG